MIATIDKIRDNSAEEIWKMQRFGKFTASSIYKLLSKGKDGSLFGKGALTYINEIACDAYTGFEDVGFESYDMKMGKIQESQAVAHHQKLLGVEITHYGDTNPLFKSYCKDSGGSPDAIIYNKEGEPSFGCEYKCPKRITHWNYWKEIKDQYDLQKACEDYYAQVQFLMEIWNLELWHWCSYNDLFPVKHQMHIVEIKPDKPFMDNLLIRLKQAIKMKHQLIEELKSK